MSNKRDSVRDRRECFERNRRVDALGRTVMDCYICQGVILPAIDKWEAEHVIPHAHDGTDVRPAHASPCHSEKTKKDRKDIAEGKRQGEKHFGIKRPKGFPKPKGAKFDWSKGRYVRSEP